MENKKLGFGLMRLPHKDGQIDYDETCRMVDLFLSSGFTYFDTAYAYEEGKSEMAARDCLIKRHPRDSFTIATKLCKLDDQSKMREELSVSLKRTEAGYIDYYLLHALSHRNIEAFDQQDIWGFVKKAKEEGLIRHYGFSFHDSPEFLDELLTKHPDVEFVQLQINYADWEANGIESRRCYEVARRHHKPIVIMEPVKGGALANPPKEGQDLFKAYDPKASFASWALRFAFGLDGVLAVLSGMSDYGQTLDNCRIAGNFVPLNDQEREILAKVQSMYAKSKEIPCTACSYCTKGCPMSINIPGIFKARNIALRSGALEAAKKAYEEVAKPGHEASSCIACGQCEGICPQGLKVISLLKECKAFFGH